MSIRYTFLHASHVHFVSRTQQPCGMLWLPLFRYWCKMTSDFQEPLDAMAVTVTV